jgi:hypothetical protein
MAEILVMVTGPVGSGKSAILGEIEIALKAIGVPVRHMDEAAARSERNMTHANWTAALEMYQPTVTLFESPSVQRPDQLIARAEAAEARVLSLETRLAAMGEALKPFADFADNDRKVVAALPITAAPTLTKRQLTMGDCYTARDILSTEASHHG